MILKNINNLIQESENENKIHFKNYVISDVTNTSDFFKRFNEILNPPKKFTNWTNFQSQMMTIESWLNDKILISYYDNKKFKKNNIDEFKKSQEVCNIIFYKYKMTAMKPKYNFVFNHNSKAFSAFDVGFYAGIGGLVAFSLARGAWETYQRNTN